MAIHEGKLSFTITVDTNDNPNEKINKFLDEIQKINLTNVSWDDVDWYFTTDSSS